MILSLFDFDGTITTDDSLIKFIKKHLINGTIVCFDDYFNNCGATDQGEARALDEFLQANKTIRFIPYFNFSPLGKSFIVRLN